MADELLSDEDLGLTAGGPKVLNDSDLGLDKPPEDVSAGMALRGIPVLGAYVPQAEAAIRAAAHPLTGVGEEGATYSERYAKNLPKREADYAKAEKDSPIASTALQVAGGAAALAPLGATALGAKVLGGAGSLGQRVGAGMASGAGISAADALARGEDTSTAAGIGAGIGAAAPVIGAAVGRIGRAGRGYANAPTADEFAPVVDHGYETLRKAGVEFNPNSVNRAMQQIVASSGLHPTLTPDTISLLAGKQAQTAAHPAGSMSALTGVQPAARPGQTFDDLDTLRKQLGAVARDYSKPTEQLAARTAMRGIDDYIANITPADVLRGNASQISALAKEARGNAAAEFRLRAMNAIRERAELQAGGHNSGLNVENSYRQQLKNFIRPNNKGISPAKTEGFEPQEIYQIRKAVTGTSFPNLLRIVGNILGGGHSAMAGAGLLASWHFQDPRYAMAAGAGMAGRRVSNAMMRSRADKLSRMTGARSPLAGVKGTGGPSGPPLNLSPAQAALIGGGASLYRRGGMVRRFDRGGVPEPDEPLPASASVNPRVAADLAEVNRLAAEAAGPSYQEVLQQRHADAAAGHPSVTPEVLGLMDQGLIDAHGEPAGYNFGPYYGDSPQHLTGTPMAPQQWTGDSGSDVRGGIGDGGAMPAGMLDYSLGDGIPTNWKDFYTPNNRGTGGGFFTADDAITGQISSLYQAGSTGPSTNNWRMLPFNFRTPGHVMRNGYIINTRAAADAAGRWPANGNMRDGLGLPDHSPGFPGWIASSGRTVSYGWPGSYGQWTAPTEGVSKRGGTVPPRGGLGR
jgi:hypothetical protein